MHLYGDDSIVRKAVMLAVVICVGASCASTTTSPAAPSGGDVDAKVAMVAFVHGGAGPWAVAGFRMGEFALHELGLPRGSFDLEVIHHTPHQVRYSCMADGEAAATGASLGKLNLTLADAAPAETHTVFRRRSTGQAVDLRFTAAFAARYLDVPRDRLAEAGREVMVLRDADIFEVVPNAHP
jgi:formylmethanofuran dehydrogenase subunit E